MSKPQYVSTLANGQPIVLTGTDLIIAEWTAEGTTANSTPEWIAPLHLHHNDDEAGTYWKANSNSGLAKTFMRLVQGKQ